MHGLSIPGSFRTLQAAIKISPFVAGIIFLVFSPWTWAASAAATAVATYAKMSLSQRVGQVFIWTFEGTSFTAGTQKLLEKYQPGALIVFKRNIKSPQQIARLNSDAQAFAAKKLMAPFFLMVDQEGGRVTRLHTKVPLPSALALGRIEDTAFLRDFGRASGEVLRDLGFNVNLAPVLDISNPNQDSFIGNRAFGEDAERVAEQVVAYATGLSAAAVLPTAKHFPGHGGTVQDSHQATPKKLATYEELAVKDLVPFSEYARAEFPKALMMAHLALPNIDPSGVPSTYSTILIQEELRAKLKYDGLVITDDLEMSGAAIDKDIGERSVRAFLAGNDMMMLAGFVAHQKQAFEALFNAVKSGRISETRLKESVLRILTFKQQLALGTFIYSEKNTKQAIARLDDLSREVLRKNFNRAVSERTTPWPELDSKSRVLVLSADKRFYKSFEAGFRGATKFFPLTPKSLERAQAAIARTEFQLAVFYASGAHTAHWLIQLSPELRAKTFVVNTNHPGEVEAQHTFNSVLNINSHNPDCGFSLAELISVPEFRIPAGRSESEEQ